MDLCVMLHFTEESLRRYISGKLFQDTRRKMLKIIFACLMLVAATQASITITFPVGVNPPGGWFFGPSDGEHCTSTVKAWLGLAESKYECMMRTMRNTYRFSQSDAESLIHHSNSPSGTPGTTGYATMADNDSRKALCKAAYDCSCSLLRDWCKHYDL